MTTTKSAMIPLLHIIIDQAEGLIGNLIVNKQCSSWEIARNFLLKIRDTAPKDGSYYKTDVIATWADGMQVKVREDVTNDGTYNADLAERIRGLWLFYGGLKKPSHMSDEDYEKILSDKSRVDAAIQHLKRYSLEDDPKEEAKKEAIRQQLNDNLKTAVVDASLFKTSIKADIEKTALLIGGLLRLVEDPDMKNSGMSPIAIRAGSMELRKAMAALMRAKDVI